jgi:hypothetical protein
MDTLASSIDWIGTNNHFVEDTSPLMWAHVCRLELGSILGMRYEAVISAITGCRASLSITLGY